MSLKATFCLFKDLQQLVVNVRIAKWCHLFK